MPKTQSEEQYIPRGARIPILERVEPKRKLDKANRRSARVSSRVLARFGGHARSGWSATPPRSNEADRWTRDDSAAIGGLEDGVHGSRPPIAAGDGQNSHDRLPEYAGREHGNLWHTILRAQSVRPRRQVIRTGTSIGAVDLDFERELLVVAGKAEHLVKHLAEYPAGCIRGGVGRGAFVLDFHHLQFVRGANDTWCASRWWEGGRMAVGRWGGVETDSSRDEPRHTGEDDDKDRQPEKELGPTWLGGCAQRHALQ